MAFPKDWSDGSDSTKVASGTQRPDRPGISPEFPVPQALQKQGWAPRAYEIISEFAATSSYALAAPAEGY
jgi:hypothetical protein